MYAQVSHFGWLSQPSPSFEDAGLGPARSGEAPRGHDSQRATTQTSSTSASDPQGRRALSSSRQDWEGGCTPRGSSA